MQKTTSPSRRFNSRIALTQEVWVCWNCNGHDDVSRVRDMSLGGLFLDTRWRRVVGTPMKVDFIRAEAVVKHLAPNRGLGLKITAMTEQDRPRFAALMRRVRS